MDFIAVKEFLRGVASELDHRVMIPAKDKRVEVTKDQVKFRLKDKEFLFPKGDCILLDIEVASAETLANFVLQRMLDKVKFPMNVTRIEIGVDEGRGQGAWDGRDL
jgi:6-pyruvoyltetrahydropterin/6-carboxytetrahydropterin synthase